MASVLQSCCGRRMMNDVRGAFFFLSVQNEAKFQERDGAPTISIGD